MSCMRFEIRDEHDIIATRGVARSLAKEIGFGVVEQTKIATAVSELTRNIVRYAGHGVLQLAKTESADSRPGLEIICEDWGPGIDDIELAMREGWSSGGGLGMGLPGAKKLMDEFSITSGKGGGTRVVVRKWL